jgi:hypothetical protein
MSGGAHSIKRHRHTTRRRGAHSMQRQRLPVARSRTRYIRRGSQVLLAAIVFLGFGVGGGVAYAYFTTKGAGPGSASAGSPLTVAVTGTTGSPDLLPGGTGAAYFTLTNNNSFGATFNTVATGATVVSQNTAACPSSNVSIARPLPYVFSPSAAVGGSTTSAVESIPNLVQLASAAPTGCQGVKFTVTLTLKGMST